MKKAFALALALVLAVSLAACGGDSGSSDTLQVGASATPHAEILRECIPLLEEQGITLEVIEYGDYIVPNTAVEEGENDANYFQHQAYLDNFNAERETHLVSVAAIHYEPMGIYPGRVASIDDLPDGGTIAVPNDVTNEGRALLLLQAQGLIEVDPAAGLNATPNDITSNPKNLEFTELEAAMVPNTVDQFDLNVINSNYALQAGLNPATDALASEDAASDAAQTYANVLVVREGNGEDARIQALIEALTSDQIRTFIEETYSGSVVPLF